MQTDMQPAAAVAPAAPGQAQARWSGEGAAHTLHLAGDWKGHAAGLPPAPAGLQGRVSIDAQGLQGWDARLASALWRLLSALDRRQVELDLQALPPGLQQILTLSLPPPPVQRPATPAGPARRLRKPGWVTALGQRATAWLADGRLTLTFVGDVLLSFGRLLRGRTDMRRADLLWQIDQTGPRSVPIVSLVSLMVGLIVAYMGAAQLQRFGAQVYIADLVTVGVVREIAALMTGVILAGRVGAAFAAQLGSMRANEEIDALDTLGIDPVDHLVLPRVLAMLLVAPLLMAYASLVGMAAGGAVAVLIYGVGPLEYFFEARSALTLPHVLIGLLKGTVYAVLVAMAGCRQGLHAGRSAQAVGDATTQAVVKSVVWIVSAASLLTIVFQRLDW